MATYRFEAKIIGRSAGSSATASAAYRSAEKLADERTGAVFDYTRKRGVLHAEILAPPGTPEWMTDRAQLWNAVEKVEKRKDLQLARDVLLSLPHELTHLQRLDLVREFVTEEFVKNGMVADIAIHAPDRQGDGRNHHAHVMLTMRELTGEGFGPKVREWNSTEQLENWREDWAVAVNRHLERYGHEARVDHRSNADQGLDREPEPKQGPVATEMERAGRPSHAGDDRRAAQERNKLRATLADELAAVSAEIIDLQDERAKRAGQGTMSGTVTVEEATRSLFETIERRNQAQQAEQAKQPTTAEAERRRTESLARENARQQVSQTEQMKAMETRLRDFLADQQRRAEEARQQEERKKEAAARGNAAEGGIQDADDRYRSALAQHYDIRDPYASLARAAMAEYGSFIRDREQLNRQIAEAKDAESRRLLELHRDIQAADYMSITSQRIAGQSAVITGRRDSEEAVKFHERATEYQTQSQMLRQEYRDLVTSREERELSGQTGVKPTGQGSESEKRRQHDAAGSPSESRTDRSSKSAAEAPAKGEVSDSAAERLARIRELAQEFRSNHQTVTRGRDRGGGGPSR